MKYPKDEPMTNKKATTQKSRSLNNGFSSQIYLLDLKPIHR